MPRPDPRMVTFTIDGLEVTAPENSMLVDAAYLVAMGLIGAAITSRRLAGLLLK